MNNDLNSISSLSSQVNQTYNALSVKWKDHDVILIKDTKRNEWQAIQEKDSIKRFCIKLEACFSPSKIIYNAEKQAANELYLSGKKLCEAYDTKLLGLTTTQPGIPTANLIIELAQDHDEVLQAYQSLTLISQPISECESTPLSKTGAERGLDETIKKSIYDFLMNTKGTRSAASKGLKQKAASLREKMHPVSTTNSTSKPTTKESINRFKAGIELLMLQLASEKDASFKNAIGEALSLATLAELGSSPTQQILDKLKAALEEGTEESLIDLVKEAKEVQEEVQAQLKALKGHVKDADLQELYALEGTVAQHLKEIKETLSSISEKAAKGLKTSLAEVTEKQENRNARTVCCTKQQEQAIAAKEKAIKQKSTAGQQLIALATTDVSAVQFKNKNHNKLITLLSLLAQASSLGAESQSQLPVLHEQIDKLASELGIIGILRADTCLGNSTLYAKVRELAESEEMQSCQKSGEQAQQKVETFFSKLNKKGVDKGRSIQSLIDKYRGKPKKFNADLKEAAERLLHGTVDPEKLTAELVKAKIKPGKQDVETLIQVYSMIEARPYLQELQKLDDEGKKKLLFTEAFFDAFDAFAKVDQSQAELTQADVVIKQATHLAEMSEKRLETAIQEHEAAKKLSKEVNSALLELPTS